MILIDTSIRCKTIIARTIFTILAIIFFSGCGKTVQNNVYYDIYPTDDLNIIIQDSIVRSFSNTMINEDTYRHIDSLLLIDIPSTDDCIRIGLAYNSIYIGHYDENSEDDRVAKLNKEQEQINTLSLAWFRRALRKNSISDEAKLRIAEIYCEMGDVKTAQKIFHVYENDKDDTLRCHALYGLLNSLYTPVLSETIRKKDIKNCLELCKSYPSLFPDRHFKTAYIYIRTAHILKNKNLNHIDYYKAAFSQLDSCKSFQYAHRQDKYYSHGRWSDDFDLFGELKRHYMQTGDYEALLRLTDAVLPEDGEISLGKSNNFLPVKAFALYKLSDSEYENILRHSFSLSKQQIIKGVQSFGPRTVFNGSLSDDLERLKMSLNINDAAEAYDMALFFKQIKRFVWNDFMTDSKNQLKYKEYLEAVQAYEDVKNNKDLSGLLEALSLSIKMNRIYNEIQEQEGGNYSPSIHLNYKDVAGNIGEDEVAIEIIDYISIEDLTTVCYDALILRKEGNPKRVRLCTQKDLDAYDEMGYRIFNGNTSYKLYDLIWGKLAEEIKESDKVYFATSGTLQCFCIENLFDYHGNRAADNYNLVRLSSTKELCQRNTHALKKAVLYGGLHYEYPINTNAAYICRNGTGNKWRYLPGTKREIDTVGVILENNGVSVDIYSELEGTETAFKNISGKQVDIIHIATHGFYLSNKNAHNLDYYSVERDYSVIDVLKRSGLLLSNSQKAWLGEKTPYDIDDGILLSNEISQMNLRKTSLVVLSACNTGKGEATFEGVAGLQSAFKNAGAQTLIMNLWEMDDEAAVEFYTSFYKMLFEGQLTKRQAFDKSVNVLRNNPKYSSPYYWAGLIMID